MDRRARSADPEPDGHHRQDRHDDDLRHRPAHPQGRRPGGHVRPDPRPRGRRRHHRGRQLGDPARRRRQRDHLVHQVVRSLQLLPAGHLRALPGRRGSVRDRLGLRPPDRRHPGRVRAGALCRDLRLQGPRGRHQPAGRAAQRHPADGIRDRRPVRAGEARGRGRRDRCRPGRAGRDGDRRPVRSGQDHRGRPGRQQGRAGRRSSAPRTASTPATPTGRSRSWR